MGQIPHDQIQLDQIEPDQAQHAKTRPDKPHLERNGTGDAGQSGAPNARAATLDRSCLCRANLMKQACGLLGDLANAERLMIVALLDEVGELHVNEMVDRLGASRASLSRQLGRLRDQAVVTTRRKHNRIYYTLNHPKAAALIKTLNTVTGASSN